jgi:tetratricopeptide (TPR) repeat protein
MRAREASIPETDSRMRAGVSVDLANALHGYGLALYNRRRLEEALPAYEEAARRAPKDAGIHYGLGLTATRLGASERAEKAFSETILLDPSHVGARYQRGLVREKRGDVAAAVEDFRAAFEGNPSHKGVMMNLGRALRRLSAQRSGEEASALRAEGDALLERYRNVSAVLDEIEETSRRATREPRNAGVRLKLCTLYAEIGDVPRSAESVRQAMALREELRSDPICRGIVSLSLGKTAEARSLLEAAKGIRPEFPDTYLFLSLLDAAEGKSEDASRLREDYERRKEEKARAPRGRP